MKRILTAINNPILNEKLKQIEYIEVVGKDIQYKEGIIEFLENSNKKIDIIIMSEKLPGNLENKKILEKIKNNYEKIKIIYILEKQNKEKENEIKKLNINSIYYNDKITVNEIINIISENEINKEEEMKKEIKKLKEIIEKNKNLNSNKKEENFRKKNTRLKNKIKILIKEKIKKKIKLNKININNKIKNIKYKNKKTIKNNKIENKTNIIRIIGSPKAGKTTISLLIGETLAKKNNKILFIDLDKKQKTLTNILLIKNKKLKKYKNSKNKIKNIIRKKTQEKITKKITNKIKIKKIYNRKNEIEKITNKIFLLKIKNQKQKNICQEIKKYKVFFDFIIVDTKNKNDLKEIDKISKEILIINSKILGVQELKRILNRKKNNSHNTKNGLHIIINKANKNTIMKDILTNTFKNIEEIIYIKDRKKYKKVKERNLYNKKIEKIIKNR